jgi:AAA15 family ATPase/GTPase
MIKRFVIENFRGFEKLELDDFQRFNVITGLNNVGKTALLEALFLHIGPTNPELPLRLQGFRGINVSSTSGESLWGPIFHNFDISKIISLKSYDLEKRESRLEIKNPVKEAVSGSYKNGPTDASGTGVISTGIKPFDRIELLFVSPDGNTHRSYAVIDEAGDIKFEGIRQHKTQGIFVFSRGRGGLDEDAERYSQLDMRGEADVIKDAIFIIEHRLKRLSVVSTVFGSSVHGDIGIGRLLPVQLMGDGTSRVLTMSLSIASAPKGLVLIDEIENGIHYSVMDKVVMAVLKLAEKWNVQIFATTHSDDFIKALKNVAMNQEEQQFSLYRFDRINDKIRSVHYNQNAIINAAAFGWEIRG